LTSLNFPGTEESRLRLAIVLLVTFVLATAVTAQIKAELLPTSNRVARNQALVRSVQGLEQDNAGLRAELKSMSDQIAADTARLAQTSAGAQQLETSIRRERELAGLTQAAGPGIVIDLSNGRDPHNPNGTQGSWRVGYIDIQDVVNLLWRAGGEAISVNRQRVVPASSFYVAGSDVLLNGVHLSSPYHVEAIGDDGHFNDALAAEDGLSDLKSRSQLYQLKLTWHSERNLTLAPYDGALVVRYATGG
jgi:uncharacterized protein YlxW (UPF0749 family)